MRNYLSPLLMLAVLLTCAEVFPQTLELSFVPASVRVRQEGVLPAAVPARIACARNEYESFQVVVTPRDGMLRRGAAQLEPFRDAAGNEAPAIAAELYRAHFVPVRYSAPRATEAPGLIADPLIPFVDPYTGEAVPEPGWRETQRVGPRFGAVGYEVFQDMRQPLWVDVFVPPGTPAGEYRAVLQVSGEGLSAELPLLLEVWDFTLPSGPTHENHFGGLGELRSYHGLESGAETYQVLEERYAAMMAQHRLNPPLPAALHPEIGEDGAADFSAVDADIGAFVTRHHVTNFEIPRAPFRDPTGEDRDKALNFFRSWYAYLASRGWDTRAYHYMFDEPNDPEAYARVRTLGALVREAEPRIRRLVVEQPYTHDADWGTLDEAVDIWCPLFSFIDEASVQRVLAQGDTVWSYTALVQPAHAYHPDYANVRDHLPPFWQLDFPVISYRIAPWLNRRYDVTGLLYWSSVHWRNPPRNPWDDPGFRIRWNGEGFLLYPGDEAGIEGPIATIRLKNLRDGLEDYEYFVLLEARGGKEAVEAIVREAVPAWGSWQQDPAALEALRRKLAAGIVAASGSEPESPTR